MRRALVAILAALALLLGAAPADAATLQPGQHIWLSHAGCTVDLVYGTFGNAFADMTILTQACNGNSAVHVSAIRNGFPVQSPDCTLFEVIWGPQRAGCALLLNPTGVRSYVASDTNGAYGAAVRLCTNASGCAWRTVSIFG